MSGLMSDEDIIKQLYIDLCNASINKDYLKLNEILEDDYILIHMTGMKQSKKDYINSVLNGELKYYEVKHDSIDITIDGNKANVIGKTKTFASPFNMSKSWWNLRQDLTLEKVNNKWKIKSSIAKMY